jgi:ankyrin repeat protein
MAGGKEGNIVSETEVVPEHRFLALPSYFTGGFWNWRSAMSCKRLLFVCVFIISILFVPGCRSVSRLGGEAVLLKAAGEGDLERVKKLLSRDVNVDARGALENTPLHCAAEGNHTAVVKLLLSKDAKVDAANEHDDTPLMLAAQAGHADMVLLLLESGADTNFRNDLGDTALILAARGDNAQAVRILLAGGARIDIANNAGLTPLDNAASRETAAILAAAGAKPQDIWNAVKLNDATKTRALLDANAEIASSRDSGERTPLHDAARYGCKEAAELLITRGAKIHAENDRGLTPLHIAACNGRTDVVSLLLKRGAEVDAIDDFLKTPLHYAAEAGCREVASLLLTGGASINKGGHRGKTPLHYAATADEGKGRPMAELLLRHGADPAMRDDDGTTALDHAVHYQRNLTAEVLRKHQTELRQLSSH